MDPPLIDEKERNLFANPAADSKKMRRIIAEDSEWSLATVPRLIDICIKHIVDNFAENPILEDLQPKHRQKVLQMLSTELPLAVTAPLIADEGYWKRCCQARWGVCDTDLYDKSWKRMFFERNFEGLIEDFVPEQSDINTILTTLELSKDFIIRLRIKQLLPRIKDVTIPVIDEDASEQGSDLGSDDSLDHFDFGEVLEKLPRLQELSLTYGVASCGMNFEWSLFEFTEKDCRLLSAAIGRATQIKVIRLERCQLDDDKARRLISSFLDHPNLEVLDLAHNRLGDKTGRAIGKLLSVNKTISEVNLCDNRIRAEGASAIAFSLRKNNSLRSLNLKLNRIGEEGGRALCSALAASKSLLSLDVSSNGLGEHTAHALAEVFTKNQVLETVAIACNRLGVNGGRVIQEGLEENKAVTSIDLRLTEISQQCEHSIMNVIRRNKEQLVS